MPITRHSKQSSVGSRLLSRSPCPKRERRGARVAVVCAMPKSRSGAKCAVLICLGLLGMDQAGLDASAAIAAIAAMALAFFSCLIELQCFGKAPKANC